MSNESDGVLDLRRLEKPEAFVDVRQDPTPFERFLELPMAVARPKEDRDVTRSSRPSDSGHAISNNDTANKPRDLPGNLVGSRGNRLPHQNAESIPHVVAIRGRAHDSGGRKPVFVGVPESVGAARRFLDRTEEIVHERQNRRHSPEADRDRPARIPVASQAFDEGGRLVEQRALGVAKGVDGLLAIADHEDGREKRVGRGAEAFAPSSDELGHQLPLCAARVLKFVDEHVAVAALQPKTTQRELVEVFQQADGSFEHADEVEARMRVEGPLILRDRDGVGSPDAPRQDHVQIPPEATDCLGHFGSNRGCGRTVTSPGHLGPTVARPKPRAAEFLSAGTTVLRHEIAAQAVHEPAEPRLAVARLTTWCAHVARKIPHIVGEHGELGAPDGSLVKESVQTTANAAKSVPEVLGRLLAHEASGQATRTCRQIAPQGLGSDQTSVQQARQAGAKAALTELGEDQRDVVIGAGNRTADAERLIERFLDQSWHLRVVSQLKAGIDVRLERELADQGQAEGVDGRDGNAAQASPEIAPARVTRPR